MSIRRLVTTAALPLAAVALSVGACSSSDTSSSTPIVTTTEAKASNTIVDVAAANPDFSTLVAAVKAAGLADTLAGSGPFTVFAPTNAAFAKLPAGTVESLLKPENKQQLTSILTYHVIAATVKSADVMAGAAATVNGAPVTLAKSGSAVTITDGKGDKASVIAADVAASNGVIHVIDTVLLPPTN